MSVFNIKDYPDVQAAIDACGEAGGGTVLIPAGTYRIRTIKLYSNMVLHLEAGAVLIGPDSIEDYACYDFPWELYKFTLPLIYAEYAHNIQITGKGKIDFNGRKFAKKDKISIADNIPTEFREDAHYAMPGRDERPNRLVFFRECENIEISGVTFADSPTWTLVFHRCSGLDLHDFRVENNLRIPNNDGIHCCGCRDVMIRGCSFCCGDDGIAITSISDESAVNERILISDCIFQSRSAAIRIGFQGGKVRDVQIRNCMIHDSNRGLTIFAGKGGFVKNVSIDGLTLDTRIFAGYWWGKGEPLVICSSEADSPIENISFRNAVIRSENSIIVSGVDGSISGVSLENLNMELGYGTRRPWYGKQIDLSPNPGKGAPDAETSIPWLWTDGNSQITKERILVRRKNGETICFSTEEVIS